MGALFRLEGYLQYSTVGLNFLSSNDLENDPHCTIVCERIFWLSLSIEITLNPPIVAHCVAN